MRMTRFAVPSLFAAILAGLVLLQAGCGNDCPLTDDAAACVNGYIITKEDVSTRIDILQKGFGAMVPAEDEDGDGVSDEAFVDFRREVTYQLVKERLELAETEKRGITVSGEEIDEFMRSFADESFLGDFDAMLRDFAERGISEEDLRNDAERTLLHEKLEEQIREDIEVTDEDARAYYDDNISQYIQPDRVTARQLVTDDEAAARKAVERLRAGENFIDIVDELSVDPEAGEKKGALGLVAPGQLAPELDSALFALEVGQITDPIQVGSKWYVLTVEAEVPGYEYSFDQKKEEIKYLRRNQLFAEEWKALVKDVYCEASIAYDPDYDPSTVVDVDQECNGNGA